MSHTPIAADSTKKSGRKNDKTTLNWFVHSSCAPLSKARIWARQMMRVALGLHADELTGWRILSIVQLPRPHPVVEQPLIH